MLTCRGCGKTGFNKEFSKRKSEETTLCLSCKRAYDREYYKANRIMQRAARVARTIKQREKAKKAVWDFLLKNPCVDCGEADPVVLEFDHTDPVLKRNDVSVMKNGGFSLASLLVEIEKCEVRCANCHRRKTVAQFGYYQGLVQK